MAKVCFARVDRIGDLVLTIPSRTYWDSKRSGDKIVWLLNENLRFVAESVSPPLEALYVKQPAGKIGQIREAFRLGRELKSQSFDEVLAIHVPWWVAMAFWLAAISRRTGPASQWFSWIFFNKRLRQRRSEAVKHEGFYNLDLAAFALGESPLKDWEPAFVPAVLKPRAELVSRWSEKLRGKGADVSRFVVLHPGMGGSARNWPGSNYKLLASRLISQGVSVVVTGSPLDETFVRASGLAELQGVVMCLDETTGPDLLAVLSLAKAVVAPSTGVAHLAAALGRPVAGIYSPVRVQAPLRWKPMGPSVKVFAPEADCPGIRSCVGSTCRLYDCMERITVESVLAYVMDKVK